MSTVMAQSSELNVLAIVMALSSVAWCLFLVFSFLLYVCYSSSSINHSVRMQRERVWSTLLFSVVIVVVIIFYCDIVVVVYNGVVEFGCCCYLLLMLSM